MSRHINLRRLDKTPDAGDESALAFAPGARCSGGIQRPGQYLDLGIVWVIVDGDDGPAPAHRLPGEARRVVLDLGQFHRRSGVDSLSRLGGLDHGSGHGTS